MANVCLAIASVLCVLGMAWFALAMDVHWKQVRTDQPSARTAKQLRVLGSLALLGALVLCLNTDHASMASLVWVMLLAAAALIVAFTFSWRPRLFSVLILWATTQ